MAENLPTAFLSWLRLATYMAVVAVAILISFHLKHRPSDIEKRLSMPFGIIFWLLAMSCLIAGLNNYIKTVNRYANRRALVQSGIGTQVVSAIFLFQLRILSVCAYADGRTGIYCGGECDYCRLCVVLIYECHDAMRRIGNVVRSHEACHILH